MAMKSAFPSSRVFSPRSGSNLPTVMTGTERTFLKASARGCSPLPHPAHIELGRKVLQGYGRFGVAEVVGNERGIVPADPMGPHLDRVGPGILNGPGYLQAVGKGETLALLHPDEPPHLDAVDEGGDGEILAARLLISLMMETMRRARFSMLPP